MNKLILLLPLLLTACSSNPFLDSYNTISVHTPLQRPQHVKLIETTNIKERVLEYKNKGYIVLGAAHLAGEWKPRTWAIKAAKEKGATLVILSSQFSGTREHSYVTAVPQVQTTYHTGSVNASTYTTGRVGGYNGVNYNASTLGHASYSGTSTTIGTSYFQSSYETVLFDQTAVFLAAPLEGNK